MTNWRAMQVPQDKSSKKHYAPSDVKPKYMTMGSWHADLSRGGSKR